MPASLSGKKCQGKCWNAPFPHCLPTEPRPRPPVWEHRATLSHTRALAAAEPGWHLLPLHRPLFMDNTTGPEGSSWLPLRTAFSYVEWSIFLERVHSSVTPATLAWQPDLPVLLLIIALKKRKQNCYQSEWAWFTILSFACKVSNSNTKHLSVH